MVKQKAAVVEDSLPNQIILAQFLTKMGFEVQSFNNGQEAWARFEAEPDGWAFVFSDVMMPKMDGLGLLSKIRNHPQLKNLPVYLVTAMSDKNYVVEAKKYEVTGYILKPISYAMIVDKLQPLFPDMKFPPAA